VTQRSLTASVAFLLLALSPGAVRAYPQYIGKGYTNCVTCHYNPTGGGLLNSYGHAAEQAAVPDLIPSQAIEALRATVAKPDVTGLDANGNTALQADVGLDARLLFLSGYQTTANSTILIIPMLAEPAALAAYGPVLVYASVTPRRTGPQRIDYSVFSREHWLMYRISDSAAARVGRLVLPFGLRVPDHTTYTREDLGFDKFDQSYAAEVDWYPSDWLVAVAGYAGDLLGDPKQLQERGGVISVTRNQPARLAAGASVLRGRGDLVDRTAAALFARLRMVGASYLLAELDGYQRRARDGGDSQRGAASLLRVGWFARESLDLYIEAGVREIEARPVLQKIRIMGGVDWQVLPWVTLMPVIMNEYEGHKLHLASMVQLHLLY